MTVAGPGVLHQVLINLGLLSLILPFVSLRVLGLLLILPGIRHLMIWKLSDFIQSKMNQYQNSPGQGNFFYFRTQNTSWSDIQDTPTMKDVTPIEVSKIEDSSKK